MKRTYVIAVIGLTLALAACSSGSKPTSSPSPSVSSRPASTAKLTIVSPTPGQVVSTEGVIVKVSLEGATLAKQASTTLRPDQGHVHLLVDAKTITLLGALEVSTGPLTPGPHLIEVEFAANDHGPFNPRVLAQVSVRAE
ncbi:MAG: hypothetical protein WAT66_01230 [Actinomycetota bacterium]